MFIVGYLLFCKKLLWVVEPESFIQTRNILGTDEGNHFFLRSSASAFQLTSTTSLGPLDFKKLWT